MLSICDYLDQLATRQGFTSDGQISRYLSVSRQAVSRYRNDAGTPDNDICWRIAEGAAADYSAVVATAEVERAKRAHDAPRVRLWAERLQHMSAAILLFSLPFLAPSPAAASITATVRQCILC